MGDDAEYYMEQEREEAMCQQAEENSRLYDNTKSLYFWVDGEMDEIWEWQPMTRVKNIFFDLYNYKKIGQEYFLVVDIPFIDYWDDQFIERNKDTTKSKVMNNLEFNITNDEDKAKYEIIILSKKDLFNLKIEAVEIKKDATSLKETMLSEMLSEIVSLIENNKKKSTFLFAREI